MTPINKAPYWMNSQKAARVVTAGIVGSVAMMTVAYILRAFGVPAPDFAAQYGAILNMQVHPPAFSGPWWAGMAWHTINGAVIFAFLYDYLTHKGALPASPGTRGTVYGSALWLVVSLLVAPLAGEGVFFRWMANPVMVAVGALASWVVYGAVLERMLRTPTFQRLGVADESREFALHRRAL